MSVSISTIDQYIDAIRPDFESKLKLLVDIPSVSMDPSCKKDIERTAKTAQSFLQSIGAVAEIIPTSGYPIVFGEIISDPSYPTVTIYNHLDVQPAEPAQWKTPPFSMTIEESVYRGRGTTDDKGPALTVMYATQWVNKNHLPLNIKFIWELEEEIGSPHFEEFLQQHKKKLHTNSIVVSDTIWVSREHPAIPYGLRGLQVLELQLKTGNKDIHSGLAGGLARNPLGELSQLLSECYDARTGEVKIPGFYDSVRRPSKEEISGFVKSGFTIDGFKQAHELYCVRTNDPGDGSSRIWALPTFEIHGIVGGYTGSGVKTIIPHQAEAKISMRLVPDQDPDTITNLVTNFIKKNCPDCQVIRRGALRPYLGTTTGPFAEAAQKAIKLAFGREPVFTREGGSIGAVVSMHESLQVPIIFLGLSLPEHGYHAINENYDWQQAAGGIRLFAHYFTLLSSISVKQ